MIINNKVISFKAVTSSQTHKTEFQSDITAGVSCYLFQFWTERLVKEASNEQLHNSLSPQSKSSRSVWATHQTQELNGWLD